MNLIVFMLWPLMNESAPVVHISHKRMRRKSASIWPLIGEESQQNWKDGPSEFNGRQEHAPLALHGLCWWNRCSNVRPTANHYEAFEPFLFPS
jgi:hypothetical protein